MVAVERDSYLLVPVLVRGYRLCLNVVTSCCSNRMAATEKPVGISIPIRIDNDGATLEAAVRSLVEGLQIPYEILLLDDGESTDNSSVVARRLAAEYPTVRAIDINPCYDWISTNFHYRWYIFWDGDVIATAMFLEKLHELPLSSSNEDVLRIPSRYGYANVIRTDRRIGRT